MLHAPSFPATVLDPAAAKMLMHKKGPSAICEPPFKERVMAAEKGVPMSKHWDLEENHVPNHHIMKATQSLHCQGLYVGGELAQRRFYWVLTTQGVQHLHQGPVSPAIT